MFPFRRRRRRKGDSDLDVQLPITPMLDMAFQIFAFFAATYQPSAFEGQMQLNLPAIGEAKSVDDTQKLPDSDRELKLSSAVTIKIKTTQDGINDSMPSHYLVSTTQSEEHKVDTLDALEKELMQARAVLGNDDEVTIKADSRLRYTYVIQVMDLCTNPKKAGFKHVGFGPPPDLETSKGK